MLKDADIVQIESRLISFLNEKRPVSELKGTNFLSIDSIDALYNSITVDDRQDSLLDVLATSKHFAGVLEIPYYPNVFIEYAVLKEERPSIDIKRAFPQVRSCKITKGTKGISAPEVVAIFPESFKGHIPRSSDPIFYFVNKFSERHKKFTYKLICQANISDEFLSITTTSENAREKLATNWVHLHEFFHRTGPLPITNALFEKSNRYSASLEELRVDLLSIDYCLNRSIHQKDNYYKTAIFILSERLLGYPLFLSEDNYDAISSVIFFQLLLEKGLIALQEGTIKFNVCIKESIRSLIKLVKEIELSAAKMDSNKKRKTALVESAKRIYRRSTEARRFFENNRRIYDVYT